MTSAGSTGARWVDVMLIGFGILAFPLMAGIVLLTHPGLNLDPGASAFILWSALIGASVIAVGLGLGKRTSWKVPGPKVTKTG